MNQDFKKTFIKITYSTLLGWILYRFFIGLGVFSSLAQYDGWQKGFELSHWVWTLSNFLIVTLMCSRLMRFLKARKETIEKVGLFSLGTWLLSFVAYIGLQVLLFKGELKQAIYVYYFATTINLIGKEPIKLKLYGVQNLITPFLSSLLVIAVISELAWLILVWFIVDTVNSTIGTILYMREVEEGTLCSIAPAQ